MSNNYIKFGKNLVSSFWVITSTDKQDRHIRRNEKALGETQTLRAGCSKEPTIFAPPQTAFPGVQDGQNLISCRWSLPLSAKPVWRRSMHAISSYRGNRPTYTHPPTHRQLARSVTKHNVRYITLCGYHLQVRVYIHAMPLENKKLGSRWQTVGRICAIRNVVADPPPSKKTPLPVMGN